jgi:hypothetical protein
MERAGFDGGDRLIDGRLGAGGARRIQGRDADRVIGIAFAPIIAMVCVLEVLAKAYS